MKTLVLTLTVILALHYNFLFAADPSVTANKKVTTKVDYNPDFSPVVMHFFAPVTPAEATFEDIDLVSNSSNIEEAIKKFAPITPKEATFDDDCSVQPDPVFNLAPVTPKEATFDDSPEK